MAALTTLAIASLAASAVGTGVAIYGQQQAAKTAASVGDYNAKISKMTGDYNAAVSEQNAKQVADTSEYNAQVLESQALQTEMDARENIRRKRIENARYASTQRARFAASGVTEEGSPLEAMAETAALLEMDAQEVNRQAQINASRIRAGAAEERRQGLFQAGQYKQQAGFDRFYGEAGAAKSVREGQAQASAYKIGSYSTLLSGVGNMAGSAYTFRRQGAI